MKESAISKQFKKEINQGKELERQYSFESGQPITEEQYHNNAQTNALPKQLTTDASLSSAQVNPSGGSIQLARKPIYDELLKELRMKQLLKIP